MAQNFLQDFENEQAVAANDRQVPTAVSDLTQEIAESIAAKAKGADRGISISFLSDHLDQPYFPELIQKLTKLLEPQDLLAIFSELSSSDYQVSENAIVEALQKLDPLERIRELTGYESLSEVEAIRRESLLEVSANHPGEVLRNPKLIEGLDNFAEAYLDAYSRATPEERVGILTPASRQIETIPGGGEKQIKVTDEMLKEATELALRNLYSLNLDESWLAKQDWFKSMDHDFKAISSQTSPTGALRGLYILHRAQVDVPASEVDKVADRILKEDPHQLFDLWGSSKMEELGITGERLNQLRRAGINDAIESDPVLSLEHLRDYGKELFSEVENEKLLKYAANTALLERPAGYLAKAIDFPYTEKGGLESLATAAFALANADPKALLNGWENLSPLEHVSKVTNLLTALGNLKESDPGAILSFRNAHRIDSAVRVALNMIDLADVTVKAASIEPKEIFHNLDLLEDNPEADKILVTAASALSPEEVLRYTGIPSLDILNKEEQLEHLLGNSVALKQWITDKNFPNYQAMFEDKGVIRALQIRPEWLQQTNINSYEQNDLRLSIGRNLYAQEKPITESNVRDELEHIGKVREKYGDVEIFSGRTVLLAANNELLENSSARFAGDQFVSALTLAADGKLEKFSAPSGTLNADQEKKNFLDRIRNCNEPLTIYLRGHGEKNRYSNDASFSLSDITSIRGDELASAFNDRLKMRDPDAGSRVEDRDILILDCCFSYNAARTFYDSLLERRSEGLPIVIGASELGQYGYSNFESNYGSDFAEHVIGLGSVAESKGEVRPTIKDVIRDEVKATKFNSFILAPNEKVPYLQIALADLILPPFEENA